MKKVLNPRAFVVLVVAISANILYWLISLIASIIQLVTEDMYAMIHEVAGGNLLTDDMINAIIGFAMFIVVIVYVWGLLLNGYFLFRLIRNRSIAQGQGYLVFMFVLHILGTIFNGFSLLFGLFNFSLDTLTTMFVLAINIMVIVGYSMQRTHVQQQHYVVDEQTPPVYNDGNFVGTGGNNFSDPFSNNNIAPNNNVDPIDNNNTPSDNNNNQTNS